MKRILVADDRMEILTPIAIYLERKGYEVLFSQTAFSTLETVSKENPDCLVLDVELPDGSGLDVCRKLKRTNGLPIIFLSAHGEPRDRVQGLLAGGDDYISRPCSLMELELRIKLRTGEHSAFDGHVLTFGSLTIDIQSRSVKSRGLSVPFTRLEFDLLACLAKKPGQVCTYSQLYDCVWQEPLTLGIHNLQMCVARIRQKLKSLCPDEQYIETVQKVGYRFLPYR